MVEGGDFGGESWCLARHRERRAESSGSSHATLAFPSARTGPSSCGSKYALERSSEHQKPCRPLPGLSMLPAVKPAHRIGAVLSFGPTVYLNR
jgi:hypothetical protein